MATALLPPEIEARLTTSALWSRIDPAAVMSQVCGLTPDPWQARSLRLSSTGPTRHRILVKPRQVGGSELAVAEICRTLLAGRLAVVMSPSERQSIRLVRRARRALTRYAEAGHPAATPTNHALLSLTIKSGGEAQALGAVADTARGFDGIGLLVLDEIAHWPEDAALETSRAVLPALGVSAGRILGVTTPGFTDSWAHRAVTGQIPGFFVERISLSDCPRWTPEAIADLRAMLGPDAASVELDGRWRSPDEAGAPIWSSSDIAAQLGWADDDDENYDTDAEDRDLVADRRHVRPVDVDVAQRPARIWTPDRVPQGVRGEAPTPTARSTTTTADAQDVAETAPGTLTLPTVPQARSARPGPVHRAPGARRSGIRSLAELLADDDEEWCSG